MSRPRSKIMLILGLIAIDQWTKYLAVTHLRDRPPQIFLDNLFRLEYAENTGAFLSLGAALSPGIRALIFIVAVGAFLAGACWVLFRDKNLDSVTAFSLSVIIGGGVGNLIDRMLRENHGVVDFLNVGIGGIRTGIFNIADMAIMLGVILIAWKSFRKPAPPLTTEANTAQRISPRRP